MSKNFWIVQNYSVEYTVRKKSKLKPAVARQKRENFMSFIKLSKE